MNNPTDTICAIATAQGGAIGIIRLSGPCAIAITSTLFRPHQSDVKLADRKAYTLTFGRLMDGEKIIDEVLVSLFRAPHSYTGEESVEISCHGSAYILQRVLQLLISSGARLAHPGEFTQRAFLNGKMDLSQAEAVADLIASTSAASHRLAMNQMRGEFSHELSLLRERLLHFTSLIELELDFSDHEELEFANRDDLKQLAQEIESKLSRLVHSFRTGNALKNGVPVAIVGETNVGKSTLLNTLVGDERAIVSDIHGTTRDVIEDCITLGGVLFRFIDTAGIRSTNDTIESIGIARTFKKIEQAEIVLWMIDSTCAEEQINQLSSQILPLCKEKQLLILFNKADLVPATSLTTIPLPTGTKSLNISAKSHQGISELEQWLLEAAQLPQLSQEDVIVSNVRHYEALQFALASIRRVSQGLADNLSGDFISQDIRECIFHLSDIVGEVTSNEILNNIFKHFCIGK